MSYNRFFAMIAVLGLMISNICAQRIGDDVRGDLESMRSRLKSNIKHINLHGIQKANQETLYIPIKFHLVADSDGQGRISANDVLDELCTLNGQFEEVGMVFYIDGELNEFDHTPTYESPTTAGAITKMLTEKNEAGANSVNVFVTQNADSRSGNNGTTLGYYQGSNDYVVIRKSQLGQEASTLAHEMGHLFSLDHPHRGWEDNPWDVEIHGRTVKTQSVNSSQSSGSVRVELVDRSNCEESGDLLCDTPPDYNFGARWPASCPRFNEIVLDRNSDTITPMQNNFMSYFLGCGPYEFTQQQVDVMITDYNSALRRNIRRDYIPNTNVITEELSLVSPANNTTAEFYNGVALEWSTVEHADQYFLQITGGADDFRFNTTDNIIYITELSPNTIYTWSVTPYNESGGCGDKKSSILRTNDVMTSTIDPAVDGSLQLVPNPANNLTGSKLLIESTSDIEAKIQVLDTSGRTLSTTLQTIRNGNNSFEINTGGYNPGIYFVSVNTAAGTSVLKLLVN